MIQGIFSFECAVKIVAEGEHPGFYFYDPWNSFDFFIVLAGYLGSFLPVDLAFLRLVRLLRVFKLALVRRCASSSRRCALPCRASRQQIDPRDELHLRSEGIIFFGGTTAALGDLSAR